MGQWPNKLGQLLKMGTAFTIRPVFFLPSFPIFYVEKIRVFLIIILLCSVPRQNSVPVHPFVFSPRRCLQFFPLFLHRKGLEGYAFSLFVLYRGKTLSLPSYNFCLMFASLLFVLFPHFMEPTVFIFFFFCTSEQAFALPQLLLFNFYIFVLCPFSPILDIGKMPRSLVFPLFVLHLLTTLCLPHLPPRLYFVVFRLLLTLYIRKNSKQLVFLCFFVFERKFLLLPWAFFFSLRYCLFRCFSSIFFFIFRSVSFET